MHYDLLEFATEEAAIAHVEALWPGCKRRRQGYNGWVWRDRSTYPAEAWRGRDGDRWVVLVLPKGER